MTAKAYPWKNVIWDIAIESGGLDPYLVEYENLAETAKHLPKDLDADLFHAIVNGVVAPLDENGVSILITTPSQLVDSAHVTEVSVNQWLLASKYKLTWNPAAAEEKRQKVQLKQEQVILAAIKIMGLNPKRMKEEPFKSGDKTEVRNIVLRKSPELFGTAKIFDKAWERLRKTGAISSP
jgi:hypothetical protein